jgi:hypothetical protein
VFELRREPLVGRLRNEFRAVMANLSGWNLWRRDTLDPRGGERVVEATVAGVLNEIEELRR